MRAHSVRRYRGYFGDLFITGSPREQFQIGKYESAQQGSSAFIEGHPYGRSWALSAPNGAAIHPPAALRLEALAWYWLPCPVGAIP